MTKAAKDKAGKPARKKDDGNVVIDLGEVVEKKLAAAGLRTDMGRPAGRGVPPSRGLFAGKRPAMFGGGYRPWWSRFGRPWLGQDAAAPAARRFTLLPASLQEVRTGELIGGMGLGVLGNRALVRLTPELWPTNSKLLHEGIGFVAGLIPVFFKRNPTTLGVAIPGAILFSATIVDKIIDAILPPRPVTLRGSAPAASQRAGQGLAARERLAALQRRIGVGQPQGTQVPRVVARPQYA